MKRPPQGASPSLRLLLIALAALSGLALSSAGGERWFSLSMGGQKIGYLREASVLEGSGAAATKETRVEMMLTLNRLGNKVEMATITSTREDPAGRLLSVKSEVKSSAQVIRSEGIVGGREIRLTTWSGDTPYTRVLSFEGELLGPQGIGDLTRSRLTKGGDTVSYLTFSPELSQVVKGERTALGHEPIEGSGGRAAALKIQETLAGIPLTRTIWIDDAGAEIRTSQSSPFGDILAVLTEKEEALRDADAGRLPEERYQQTLAKSNVRLPRARDIDSVTLRIRHLKPELGWPEFPGPYQTVVSKTPDELILRVDRPTLPRKGPPQTAGTEDLEANAYLDTGDPMIRETAESVAGAIRDPFDKTIRLRNWVGENMIFDLGVVSPPASEVIRNRRGTCVGYAMLLTSLARAAGIPARFLMGFVYVNGIWGGHAWSEVLIDGTWVPLDAAVMGPGIADAARFHFSRSTLASGIGEASMGGSQLYGSVGIEVMQYRQAGRTVQIPSGERLYEVTGDAYRNPGLGLSVTKPAGFAFADLDRTWPDDTLLKMTGPKGAFVRIIQERAHPAQESRAVAYRILDEAVGKGHRTEREILGRTGYWVSAGRKAGAALFNGSDLWILVAEGPRAEELLESVVSTLTLKSGAASPGDREGIAFP